MRDRAEVPIRCAYQPVWVKLYHDRVAIAVGADVVAEHGRAFCRGSKVLDPFHVLPLLERKHRAVAEATALLDWRLAPRTRLDGELAPPANDPLRHRAEHAEADEHEPADGETGRHLQ
ncbi:MAG: hypothetical protein F4018_07670 [Acidobacteria bacterium]|nr:hypothetical protein [Acidobacteriota bacterium]